MTEQQKTHISKLLSLVLRHSPETIGIRLDEQGWVETTELLSKLNDHNKPITLDELEEVVATNSKQRFAFNEDHSRIRANQGHSIEIDLALDAKQPPAVLYHGTAGTAVDAIRGSGLQRMSRRHVHLSSDPITAEKVGMRHGKPVILIVDTGKMHDDGYLFYLSANNVWLTDNVPAQYINFHGYEK